MAYTAVRSKAVVLLLLIHCLLLLPLCESVIFLCFVVRNFMSIMCVSFFVGYIFLYSQRITTKPCILLIRSRAKVNVL